MHSLRFGSRSTFHIPQRVNTPNRMRKRSLLSARLVTHSVFRLIDVALALPFAK